MIQHKKKKATENGLSKTEPLISVIMGVYGNEKTVVLLERSVQSILQQTVTNLEFLINDDGSSIEVKNLLNQMAKSDTRVRLIRNNGNTTLPSKLNSCLKHAKGQFIARQDDDDVSTADRFEKQLKFLKENKKVAFVGSNVILTSEKGTVKQQRVFPEYPQINDFLFCLPFCHPTLLFRREVFNGNRYSESKWTILCEDYDLLLTLYEQGYQGGNLQTPLFYYHITDADYLKRHFQHRINESMTRWKHFYRLGLLPQALPYVIKPIIVGILPHKLVEILKEKR